MRTIFTKGRQLQWITPMVGLAFVFLAYLFVHSHKKPVAPAVPVVSSCKKLAPGMRRMGPEWRRTGPVVFQFDVPTEGFVIEAGASDMPSDGFTLIPRNSESFLNITWDDPGNEMLQKRPPVPPALLSGPAVNRKVLTDEGLPVGEDSWGYWDDTEFWRRVRLRGDVVARYGSIKPGEVASYGSVHQKEAEIFDRIINSVCVTSGAP
jgi:hypothetical protein